MEDNKYSISKGNNLGQELDVGPLNDFYYRGTMQGVFNDPAIIGEALLSVNYFTITQQNKEYREWEMSDAGEEATMSETQQKILSILPKEMLDKVYEYIENKRQKYQATISSIETMLNNSKNPLDISPIEFDEDFALLDDRKLLLHSIPMPSKADEVDGRKDLGFLASEWFGKLELFAETRFCASFVKSKGLQPREVSTDEKPKLTFIFDAGSKNLKPLLRLDLFQYSRNKQKNNLEKYTEEEIKILESLLEWNTSSMSVAQKQPTWSAIPAGVSSDYVIGVIASNVQENSKEMEVAIQVAEKFNVPLLRSDLTAVTENNLSI